ncbi:type II toxin-antitoxin system PemK/MazF family toxin [Halovivax cerinus]|uniref:Type II toxin-antitoxin system PemK/MazF family toxin n=1 Tax=Halovivax cerinus TaxID=1487865 RepID=A0ABD5NL33_9EURY|nr:type II toxin-antitoxin system PemK/MazF family toxin [Halovivax cerinus]
MAPYERGDVVKGPDLFADHSYRPFVCVSDTTHPFATEEALYAALTSTPRPEAIALEAADFESGGLPRESYVNPWTIASIRHADIDGREGRLTESTIDEIARQCGRHLGLDV